jgi:hypothetical protein
MTYIWKGLQTEPFMIDSQNFGSELRQELFRTKLRTDVRTRLSGGPGGNR